MESIHDPTTGRRTASGLEPLAVTPRQACTLLGIGNTRLYELIGKRELESYLDGRARRITLESIRRRVARLLAEVSTTLPSSFARLSALSCAIRAFCLSECFLAF
jgi:excisionase family DNA binding protein